MVPAPDEQLPVLLPEDVAVEGGGSPLARLPEFVETACPKCGADARRDTDTFDTFMESSWYFARFCCADADTSKIDERADYWMPVDQYIGGIEHAILHLMYARFYQKLMNEAGLTKVREPFSNLLTQGMVVAETFYRDADGQTRYYAPAEVEVEHDARGKIIGAHARSDGQPVEVGSIEKMSKSKNNGVDPEEMIARYGADTVRLYIIETSPPDQMLEWSGRARSRALRGSCEGCGAPCASTSRRGRRPPSTSTGSTVRRARCDAASTRPSRRWATTWDAATSSTPPARPAASSSTTSSRSRQAHRRRVTAAPGGASCARRSKPSC